MRRAEKWVWVRVWFFLLDGEKKRGMSEWRESVCDEEEEWVEEGKGSSWIQTQCRDKCGVNKGERREKEKKKERKRGKEARKEKNRRRMKCINGWWMARKGICNRRPWETTPGRRNITQSCTFQFNRNIIGIQTPLSIVHLSICPNALTMQGYVYI